jgi:hypothetical protein
VILVLKMEQSALLVLSDFSQMQLELIVYHAIPIFQDVFNVRLTELPVQLVMLLITFNQLL